MITILLTGKTGQVGRELERVLAPLGHLIAPERSRLDLTNHDAIRNAIRDAAPTFIVNAAGFTAVDLAESQPELAMRLNATAPGVMAEAARRAGAVLIHYSTSFVFDGSGHQPYSECDRPAPINVYGRSKLAGEEAITAAGGRYIILRASWTYSDCRDNFLLTILRLARERDELRIVQDQVGAPTWAGAYADATARLIRAGPEVAGRGGIYHLSAAGQATRYEWATRIIDMARRRCAAGAQQWARIHPIATAEYPLPARRPLYTVLDNSRIGAAFGICLPDWSQQLDSFLSRLLP